MRKREREREREREARKIECEFRLGKNIVQHFCPIKDYAYPSRSREKRFCLTYTHTHSLSLFRAVLHIVDVPYLLHHEQVETSGLCLLMHHHQWQISFLKRPFQVSFVIIFVFSIQLTLKVQYNLPMTGFELRTSGVGCDRSTNLAKTTAHQWQIL